MKNRAPAKNQKPKKLQKSEIMQLSKKEKNALFKLLDVVTDPDPELRVERFNTDNYRKIFWGIFKKVRLELQGI